MDVDLDKRCGLAGCASCASDAEALQFYQPDHAGLRGLQSAKEIVHHCGAYRSSAMILDWNFVIKRYCGEPRCVSNTVDPFIAYDRRDPCSEGSRWCVCMPFGMDREKCVLPRIFGRRMGKPPPIVAAQPDVYFSEQLLVGLTFASLRRGHEAAPSLATLVPILASDRCSRPLPWTNCEVGRRGPLSSIADAWP